MTNLLTKSFTEHPATVGESYFEHFGMATSFAFWLLLAGGAAILHALVPALCEKTASQIVTRLNARLQCRNRPDA